MALPVRKSNESPFEFQFNDAAILDKSILKSGLNYLIFLLKKILLKTLKDVTQVIGKKKHLALVREDAIHR